jgi:hypothetical protein
VIGFLNQNRETGVPPALNRLDITRQNEVMVIFTRFIKRVERNSISYFDIFSMFQKLMVDLGSLRVNKHVDTLMEAVSKHFS